MLHVWSDILLAADSQQVTLLGLSDLSSAFNCVDHEILLQPLEIGVCFSGVVLDWIRSFLTDRTQQVTYNGRLSPVSVILYGVPQGSVLKPLLYLLYTAELNYVVARHHLHPHQYADHCHIYDSSSVDTVTAPVHRLAACLTEVEDWMMVSRLQLNASKTEVMWLGSNQQLQRFDIPNVDILSTTIEVTDTARDLGVVIDSQLTLSAHVEALTRSCYHQLCQLSSIIWSLSTEGTRTLVQAFISCRCKSLLYGISDGLLRRLQSVQNAAARLVTGTHRHEHTTPVLRQLHWLPLRQRIQACWVRVPVYCRPSTAVPR